jgi:HPt (histidine-containing phosphotransfer) domain-containing protein
LVTFIKISENSPPVNHRVKKKTNNRSRLEGGSPVSSRILVCGYGLLATVLVGSLVAIGVTTSRLAEAAKSTSDRVELAADQASRSQRMTKALLSYERDLSAGMAFSRSLAEIKESGETFDNVLKGFDTGTKVTGSDGKEIALTPASDKEERRLIENTKQLWTPLFEQVKQLATGKATKAELTTTVNLAQERNLPILESMNGLARRSEVLGQAAIGSMSAVRNTLIGLASISLCLIPGVFLFNRGLQERLRADTAESSLEESSQQCERAETALRSLEENMSALEQSYGEQLSSLAFAQAETDRIMETVQEGLFLINREGIIGDYHSREAPLILRQEKLAGASLFSILQRYLSEKMFNSSRDFFDLLFDVSRKERTVLSVNPLTDVEVNFPNPAGGFITRYLGFSFRRIVVDGKVDRLFVALRDVTKQIELETQLREAEKTKDREMQVLLSIVHLPQDELEAFVKLATEELETINNTLRAEDFAVAGGRNEVLRERLQTVYCSVHNLKGNAALLQLNYFQKAAHVFETKIKDLLSRRTLTGDDFLSIVIAQAGLRSDLNDLQNLRSKLGNLNVGASAPQQQQQQAPASVLAEQLRQLVQNAAADMDKSARLTVDEFALHAFAHGRTDLIRDVLVQLTRNAVAHGVEPTEIREAAGKPGTAQLSIHALPAPAPGVLGLAVRDDGRGLDLELIRERAEKAGLLSPGQPAGTEELIQCIFESGFSTAEEADLHSGRGVGMDIVKSKFVETAGGCIEVLTEVGQFCEFRLYMPS